MTNSFEGISINSTLYPTNSNRQSLEILVDFKNLIGEKKSSIWIQLKPIYWNNPCIFSFRAWFNHYYIFHHEQRIADTPESDVRIEIIR